MSEIQPALTTEEWAQWRIEPTSLKGALVIHDDADGLEIVTYDVPGSTIGMAKFKIDQWDSDGIAGTMALANHARPDDDPGKITAADVFYIEEVEANLRAFVEAGHAGDFLKAGLIEYCDGAERSAAKLRALLPP